MKQCLLCPDAMKPTKMKYYLERVLSVKGNKHPGVFKKLKERTRDQPNLKTFFKNHPSVLTMKED